MRFLKYILLIIIALNLLKSKQCIAQKYADKDYYLVDSLVLEELTTFDRNLIDSCLVIFHKATDDTSKIYALDGIRLRMMHQDWVKYDEWVFTFVKESLKKQNTPAELMYLKKTIGDIYNNKSIGFQANGNNSKSLEYSIKALKIYEEVNDSWRLSVGYLNIGNYYLDNNDYKAALNYYYKGLEIAEEANDTDNIANGLLSIGTLKEEQGDYDSAMKHYAESLEMIKAYGDITRYPTTLNCIGDLYELLGNKEKAIDYYYKALAINEKVGDKGGASNSLYRIGSILIKQNRLEEAYYYAKRSYDLALEIGFPATIRSSSELLSVIYEKQGKGAEALKMYKLHVKMNDSLSRELDEAATIKLQAKFEYEKQKAVDDAEHDKEIAIEQEAKEKQTILTYATAGGLGLVGIFLLVVFNRLKVTRKQKSIIEEQKTEVEKQKTVVELAHTELEEKNKEITDSIQYAKRIQNAILPPNKVVKEYLQESFIYYKPKDIVAGDFYWLEHSKNKVLFAAADCTGHGVPGAMVSVVCNNGLNRSVREYGLTDPGEILNKTREIVVQEFEKSEEDVKDGMDIALCSIEGNKLQYAGAHNPLWIIRKDAEEIEEIKANKQPIGQFDNPEPYTTHPLELKEGDSLYIFSDGYADQFGGEKGKKLKTTNFKKLLLSIQTEPMEKQKQLIDEAFEKWKGNLEQLDDVCVIGVRI
ncbi:MAG: tetratricopeptide repeat protein [Vicingaceae bacterium]|nr:tetratricopeptide repeat protein [Vicingaceae bacterium]